MAAVSWSHGRIAKGEWISEVSACDLRQVDPGYSVTTVTVCPMVKNKQNKQKRRLISDPVIVEAPIVRSAPPHQSNHGIVRWSSRFVAGPLRARWAPQKKKKKNRRVHSRMRNAERGFPEGPGNEPREDGATPLYMWITIFHLIVHEEVPQRNSSERSRDGTSWRIWVSNRHNLFWI